MNANTKMATIVQKDHPHKNGLLDLRSPGLLVRWPLIGVSLFIFGTLLFGGLAYNLVNQGPLIAWDQWLANVLPAVALKSPVIVKDLMFAGFYIGKEVIIVVGVLLGMYFLYRRYWQELTMLVIGMAGSSLLFFLLTSIFARARPPTQIWIIITLPSFPSGHAMSVVVFYGLLAYWLVPKMPSALWKGIVVAIAFLIIGFVGFSRVFTGGHYLTDVIAGFAVGIAWSGVVFTLIEIYYQKRKALFP